ncbi:MAG: c-type cytochrome [Cyclobacteriaceae bacterium]|nr:c-type cytochrome [Cyclobacteriaceae bacterium]
MKIHNPFKFARKNAYWAITLVFILTALGSNAQAEEDTGIMMFVVSLVAITAVLVLLVAIYALQVINKLEKDQPEGSREEDSLWSRFLEIANNRAPEDKEADIMLDHNYDGIRELDNHLPPWWKWLFYITIIWGVVYLIGHHFTGWFPLQEEEYEIAMAEANKEKEANLAANAEAGGFDESTLEYTADAAMIEAGKKTFGRNCTTCHGQGGGGIAGPNLTDDYWIHGGSIKDIFRVVKEGVPNTAMIQWSNQLSPTQIQEVSNYVMFIRGTNPENALKPQGTLYEEGATSSSAGATTSSAGDLSNGKTVYDTNCAACHTLDGGGVMGLGPNLTDKYWKDSNGSREGVYKTIAEGVTGSAMMSWKALLDETQINDVTDYILAFQGTTPANPKEPEGELYETNEVNSVEEEAPANEEPVAEASNLEEGKSIYANNCAACHLADGGGIVGPNLTDNYWKNSNGTKEGIKKTIIEGVAGTSMMAWSAALNEAQIEAVTNFILSLKGTTPAAPKAPEGDLYE